MQSLIQDGTLNMMLVMQAIKKVQTISANSDEFLKMYFSNVIKSISGWAKMINNKTLSSQYFESGKFTGTQTINKTDNSSCLRTKVPFMLTNKIRLSASGYSFTVYYLKDYFAMDETTGNEKVDGIFIQDISKKNNVIDIQPGKYVVLFMQNNNNVTSVTDIAIQ